MRISLDAGYHVFDEPTEFASDFRQTAKSLWGTPIVGNLGLGILGASGLSDIKPYTEQVDTFCVVKYGPRWVRTCTVVNNSSPKWNEQSSWDVYDPCTFITVAVFQRGVDENGVGIDLFIGKVRIRLSTLEIGKVYINSYPLGSVQPSGLKKMGQLQLSVRYFWPSLLDILSKYPQPLLPTLHYILPLSVQQITLLREQTAELLCSFLGRHESPLSSTVVYSLLDTNGATKFSRRRALANVKRLKKLYDHFKPLVQWSDYIRNWTNLLVSGFISAVLLVIIANPSLIIYAMLVMLVLFYLYGFLTYLKRPRELSHIVDAEFELSLAYDVSPDWLEEELDTFPSSRYDTLGQEFFEFQTMIGDLATMGERVESLLSWRDPKATSVFTLFCLIVAILYYISPCPPRVLYHYFCCIFIWQIMMPRFAPPSIFMNFIRRLPSN